MTKPKRQKRYSSEFKREAPRRAENGIRTSLSELAINQGVRTALQNHRMSII